MYGHAMSQYGSPWAMQRAKRREQLASLQAPMMPHASPNPFVPEQPQANPFLEQKEAKEKSFKPKTSFFEQPGLFGLDRNAAMMGGLSLLMGGF